MDNATGTPLAKRKNVELSPNTVNAVGAMAVTDLMSLMSTLMDEKLKNMPTKQDFDEIKNKVNENSTKLDDLKSENDTLKSEIKQLKSENEKNHQQIMYLQKHIKRNSIVFKGISSKTSMEEAVKECCRTDLKLSIEICLISTRKLYEKDDKLGVIAEFRSAEMVKEIFKSTKNLSGTKISIERDLTTEKQQDKRVMLELKKAIKQKSSVHHIVVRNEKIRIGDKWLWWNKDKQLTGGRQSGNVVLKNLYGDVLNCVNINYHEILNQLTSKNY